MRGSPLNLTHFHVRRADTHLEHHRYDEAIKSMETALAYIEDARKITTTPEGIRVLDAETWSCSRRLDQIIMRKAQIDSTKLAVVAPQPEPQVVKAHQEDTEASTVSIPQAIENVDSKDISSTLESSHSSLSEDKSVKDNNPPEESKNWLEELEAKDLPTLAPLELPAFDLGLEGAPADENN